MTPGQKMPAEAGVSHNSEQGTKAPKVAGSSLQLRAGSGTQRFANPAKNQPKTPRWR